MELASMVTVSVQLFLPSFCDLELFFQGFRMVRLMVGTQDVISGRSKACHANSYQSFPHRARSLGDSSRNGFARNYLGILRKQSRSPRHLHVVLQFFVACEPALSGYQVSSASYMTHRTGPISSASAVCQRLLPCHHRDNIRIDAALDHRKPSCARYYRIRA